MMHRCAVGSCGCCRSGGGGIFSTSHQSPTANSPSFSFLFSAPASHYMPLVPSFDEPFDLDHDHDYSHGNHYSSPVDCTLSLATPSTRSSSGYETDQRMSSVAAGSNCMPNFCWDLFQPPKQYSSSADISNGNGGGSGNDSLLARRCANCDTTSTPLWRNGPRGPKSLCNACGIRFKKEERRAAATTAGNGAAASPHGFNSHSSWIHPDATSQSHNMAPLLLLHGSNQ